jgi:hypothetical protein
MSNFSDPPRDRADARRRAQNHFEAAEVRTKLVKDIVQAESAALDAKTAKLRALRLEREKTELEAALANPTPPVRPVPRASKKLKP